MKKLLLVALMGLTFNAQAQMMVNTNQSMDQGQSKMSCNNLQSTDATYNLESNTMIRYQVEVKEKNKTLYEFNIAGFENTYNPFSDMKTLPYTHSITRFKNTSLDAREVAKNPYIVKIKRDNFNHGVSMILHSSINKDNKILTTMCFYKSDITSIVDLNSIDNSFNKPYAIQLPTMQYIYTFKKLSSSSGVKAIVPINTDINVEITATIEK